MCSPNVSLSNLPRLSPRPRALYLPHCTTPWWFPSPGSPTCCRSAPACRRTTHHRAQPWPPSHRTDRYGMKTRSTADTETYCSLITKLLTRMFNMLYHLWMLKCIVCYCFFPLLTHSRFPAAQQLVTKLVTAPMACGAVMVPTSMFMGQVVTAYNPFGGQQVRTKSWLTEELTKQIRGLV